MGKYQIKSITPDSTSKLQYQIDSAGENEALLWGPGIYVIQTPLIPRSGQCWIFQPGAIFTPYGNNRIISIVGKENLNFQGTFYIDDMHRKSNSVEAIYIDNLQFSYFENIVIANYFNGMELRGTVGTNENDFNSINMRYIRNRGINLENQCHDNHFKKIWIKGPSPTSWASGPGLRIATDGVQGGNIYNIVGILDMDKGLDLPGCYEAWFGTTLVDNPYSAGLYIAGQCERVSFDTIWASSGGDGVMFEGSATHFPITSADKVHIGKLYTWLNANYGLRFEGYCQHITIDSLVTQRNARGLGFTGPENNDIHIGKLISMENSEWGVDGHGCGENCVINHATIYDDVFNLENFAEINGDRPSIGKFQNRGKATILSGRTYVDVAHCLENVPYQIFLSPEHAETAGAYVSSKSSSVFRITLPSSVTENRKVNWQGFSRAKHGIELIRNASVDEVTNGLPDQWHSSGGAEYSTTEYRSQDYSLRLHVDSYTADWRADCFAVKANTTYHLSGFFKGAGSSQTFLTVRWFSDPDGNSFISEENIVLNSTYSGWTQIGKEVVSPANAQSADIVFRCSSPTTANIYGDDFSLREKI